MWFCMKHVFLRVLHTLEAETAQFVSQWFSTGVRPRKACEPNVTTFHTLIPPHLCYHDTPLHQVLLGATPVDWGVC